MIVVLLYKINDSIQDDFTYWPLAVPYCHFAQETINYLHVLCINNNINYLDIRKKLSSTDCT